MGKIPCRVDLGVGAFYEEDTATGATRERVLQFCHTFRIIARFNKIQVEEAESKGNWVQQDIGTPEGSYQLQSLSLKMPSYPSSNSSGKSGFCTLWDSSFQSG